MTLEATTRPAQQRPATGERTARRIEALTDHGSFREFGSQARHREFAFDMLGKRPPGDAVVTGTGSAGGRPVNVFAQDPSVLGGSLGATHAAKITRVMSAAERSQSPVVGLIDSGGARIQEGVGALDGYGAIFRANVSLSGRVPQLSIVLGSCAGGAVYSPALTDLIVMVRDKAHMFLTGPVVVAAVTGEEVTPAELGGADVHGRTSGVAHLIADDEDEAIELARRVLGYLPTSCWDELPRTPPVDPEPLPEIPSNHRLPYDVRGVIRGLVDGGSFLELQERTARNLVVGFARVDGLPVGVVANQPQAKAGVLDSASSEKGARFVRMCDAFGLPLLTLVDTPGFLPGVEEERGGVIRRGAKLLYAFAEATVPRMTIVLRKAFGGAYIVMNSRSLGADAVYAWPTAELAVMGAEGAVDLIYRRDLAADPGSRDELIDRYRREATTPDRAAERLSVDELIAPEDTRDTIVGFLESMRGALRPRFRHDNLPQ